MSQAGVLTVNTSGGAVTETLTGNSGGAVGPDGAFNINIVGNNTNGINVIGNPGTNTLTVTAFQATTTQEGTITLATNAQSIAGTDAANAITAAALGAKLGTQTAHSLALFEGTNAALVPLGVATNGQIPIGSTGADPVLATITAGTGVTVTNAPGSITISADNTHVLETLTGNSGGAISPTAGNINTLGTGSITIAGTGSTLTTQLTGLTNHALQIGAGTATLTQLGPGSASGQILQTNAAADPTWSTATYPSTATTSGTLLRATGTNWQATASTYPSTNAINTLLYASAANTMTALATVNRAAFSTNSTGVPTWLALTDGQLVIGSTAGSPAAGTLTAGTGIAITNASNSITVATTGTVPITFDGDAGTATASGNTLTISGGTTGLTTSASAATINLTGTLVVANGGTGRATATAFMPITGGTTTTGALQSVATGTAGFALTYVSSASLPTWQAVVSNVVRQVFTATGTYTPTSGMIFCDIEVVGGGGGSGGCAATSAGAVCAGGGGGGGGYAKGRFTAATIGASQAVTIGTAGTAGSAGANAGGTGGTSSVGALISATGGVGGSGSSAAATIGIGGGAGGAGSGGDFQTTGNPGGLGIGGASALFVMSGAGGSSFFGGAGTATASVNGGTTAAASAGTSPGGGGGGGAQWNNAGAIAGAAGFKGEVIITEYCY